MITLTRKKKEAPKEDRLDEMCKMHSELMAKHDTLIQHMTQFFITSEKIKIADDKRRKEIENERETHPNDALY